MNRQRWMRTRRRLASSSAFQGRFARGGLVFPGERGHEQYALVASPPGPALVTIPKGKPLRKLSDLYV